MKKGHGEKEWITAAAAGAILGFDLRTFRKHAERWGVRTRILAGMHPRYKREDVERLARCEDDAAVRSA